MKGVHKVRRGRRGRLRTEWLRLASAAEAVARRLAVESGRPVEVVKRKLVVRVG